MNINTLLFNSQENCTPWYKDVKFLIFYIFQVALVISLLWFFAGNILGLLSYALGRPWPGNPPLLALQHRMFIILFLLPLFLLQIFSLSVLKNLTTLAKISLVVGLYLSLFIFSIFFLKISHILSAYLFNLRIS